MTKERAKELIPVIQAYAEGKAVQVRIAGDGDPWQDYSGECPNFENGNWEWRVKPEPREFWVIVDKAGPLYTPYAVFTTPQQVNPMCESIHVREVVD